MMKRILPYIIFLGLIGFFIYADLKWNKLSEEDKRQGSWCQKTAVERNYGVTFDKETRTYHYSTNKFEELRFYDFMIECLPNGYPGKREMVSARATLKKEIDKAIQDLGIGATNRN